MTKQRDFWWIKFQDDFFDRPEIKIIEKMENGNDYILLYLKLMLKSINNNGSLFINSIPFSKKMISDITNYNFEIVDKAIEKFIEYGLLIIKKDVMILVGIKDLVGKTSASAIKKRKQRQNIKKEGTMSPKCPPNVPQMSPKCPTELELELESLNKDKSLSKDNKEKNIKKENIFVFLESLKSFNAFNQEEKTAIRDWVQHKIERKEIYKHMGLKGFLTTLTKNKNEKGWNIVDSLYYSMSDPTWKGLYQAPTDKKSYVKDTNSFIESIKNSSTKVYKEEF